MRSSSEGGAAPLAVLGDWQAQVVITSATMLLLTLSQLLLLLYQPTTGCC